MSFIIGVLVGCVIGVMCIGVVGDGWGTRVISSNLTGKGAEKSGLVITAKYAEVIGNIYENPELL